MRAGNSPAQVSTVFTEGTTPWARLQARTSSSEQPQKCAIWASEKPICFTARISTAEMSESLRAASQRSTRTMSSRRLRYHRSMPVSS